MDKIKQALEFGRDFFSGSNEESHDLRREQFAEALKEINRIENINVDSLKMTNNSHQYTDQLIKMSYNQAIDDLKAKGLIR